MRALTLTITLALVAGTSVTYASFAYAQQSAREQCCKQMGGRWGHPRGRGYPTTAFFCYFGGKDEYDVPAFYTCVQDKSAGPQKK